MTKYLLTIFTIDKEEIIMRISYEKEYELKSHIVSLGKNGILQEENNRFIYTPPHKIDRIVVDVI
jgi:hypothetical protein